MLPPAWVPVLLASALQVGESAVEQMEGLRAGADDGRGAAGGCCSGPVAVAECWGWSPTNATLNTLSIQSSLDCEAASTVRVPKMPGPWVVAPPHGSGELDFAPPTGSGKIWRVAALNFSRASDKLVIFEAGCVVQAERWSFHEVRAPLAVIGSLWGLVRNLTIVGEPGARWEMWKADYQNVSCDRSSSRSTSRTCFAVSEWRHGLSIWWAHDLIVSGLTIANSGGSGVSLGGMEGGGGDRSNAVALTSRVHISNLTSDGNHREGLFLANCVTCLIEDCVFSRTSGTRTMNGVDIEPDNKGATLQDIVFRRCVSLDNMGNGFQAALFNLDPRIDPPISITFEDCHAVWSDHFDWKKDGLAGVTNVNGFQVCGGRISGSVSVIGGSVTGSAGAGLCIVDNPPSGPTVSFSNVVLRDVARLPDTGQNKGMHAAPIHLIDMVGGLGGIYLSNIVVHQRSSAPVLRYDAVSCSTAIPATFEGSYCPNKTSLRGSTIFIRPPSTAPVNASCGAATDYALASLDGTLTTGGLFDQHDVFGNISFACCTPAFVASHHDWQSFDGCRAAIKADDQTVQ